MIRRSNTLQLSRACPFARNGRFFCGVWLAAGGPGRFAMTSVLNNIMICLTALVALLVVVRFAADWFKFRDCIEAHDQDTLRQLIAGQQTWIIRHALCATAAVLLVACIRFLPNMTEYEPLSGTLTVYGMVSLGFALVDVLLVQWLGSRLIFLQTAACRVRKPF